MFQLKKNIDLIVLLNEPFNISALNESYLSKIPIISLNSDLNIQKFQSNYKVPGDFQFFNKKIRDNFFYTILIAVIKKGNKFKKFLKTYNLNFNSYKLVKNVQFLKKKKFRKKKRFKPLYKKFIKVRENVQNKKNC